MSEFLLSVLSVLLFNFKSCLFLFKLAPKPKEPKPKKENVAPNGQKEAKPKDEVKKPTKAGSFMRDNHQAANSLLRG